LRLKQIRRIQLIQNIVKARHGTDPRFQHRHSRLSSAVRFGYVYPPDRKWLIGSFLQLLLKFVQPSLLAVHLDVLERLADEAR
jgi:hypothetical protein